MGQSMANAVIAPEPVSNGGSLDSVPRQEGIDFVRGVVMVLMALDHTRDFFSESRFDLLDLSRTDPPLFLTRWVTHFCAPVFVLLAGTGAFLSVSRGKTRRQLARFLLSRGLWLVVLEFTLVQWGWSFNFEYSLLIGQVIWAIGWSMVVLSMLIFVRFELIALLAVALIAGHNLLDGVPVIHLLAIACAFHRYGEVSFLLRHPLFARMQMPSDYGYSLTVVYIVWLAVVALLYPACYWFASVKRSSRSVWLGYL
jgi:uncharacterized membrane protein